MTNFIFVSNVCVILTITTWNSILLEHIVLEPLNQLIICFMLEIEVLIKDVRQKYIKNAD